MHGCGGLQDSFKCQNGLTCDTNVVKLKAPNMVENYIQVIWHYCPICNTIRAAKYCPHLVTWNQ